MVTERAIINFLIIGASLILVPFVIYSTLTGGYAPALFFMVLLGVVLSFFFFKDNLCVWPLLGSAIAGSLNFLPLPLQATHIFCLMLILYYITGYVAIRQEQIKLGRPRFLWPILILTGIVFYHNHSLSVHALGGESEGAKPAILLFLVVLAYFCAINIKHPSVVFMSRLPLYYVYLTILSAVPYFLTSFVPGLAPLLYNVTGNVNVEAYVGTIQTAGSSSDDQDIGRFMAFGPVGAALQLYLLCRYPIGTWIRPERWWVFGLSLVCTALAILSGYRNVLFAFVVITMLGAWCYYTIRALVLPVLAVTIVLLGAVASSNHLVQIPLDRLPMIAQRTLSFLPGDWSQEAKESADSSNDFRMNIQKVYLQEYAAKSPLFGNGFAIDTQEFDAWNGRLTTSGQDPEYAQAKVFIIGKMFHTGWLSVYDIVGGVGMLTFVAFGLILIVSSGHFVFGAKANKKSILFPLYVWLFCNLVTAFVSFFAVFGDFAQTFSGFCIYAMVLSQLWDMEKITDVPVALPDGRSGVEFTGLKGALYGYQSKT